MKTILRCTVNGEPVEELAEGRDRLLDLLRERLGLTGTKEGCGNGNCGSCTVLLDGAPVLACLVLALETEGREVRTIEGVARGGGLDRVQRAFQEQGGLQCGFCTPGFILSSLALLERSPRPGAMEVRRALAGNLCRCTGYDKIVRAVLAAADGEA